MKALIGIFVLVGILMIQPHMINADDTRVTQEYLSQIISGEKEKYNVPAIAVIVMNSETIVFQEIQGVRVFDKSAQADAFIVAPLSLNVGQMGRHCRIL